VGRSVITFVRTHISVLKGYQGQRGTQYAGRRKKKQEMSITECSVRFTSLLSATTLDS